MKKILILASNPRKDLNLDDEIRLLRSIIAQSRDRDQFEVVSEPGVQVGDLQGLLLRHKPQVVHFCGHGGGKEGLIFETDGSGEQWVQADALANLFGLNPIRSHVKCVLLNACYSEEQANAIVSGIDYVVGMSHEIRDDAAIAFSKGFYLGLGEGCSIEDAFEIGKNAIQLEISGSSKKMRSTATEAQRKLEVVEAVNHTEIPEHLKPILKKKANLTSSTPASTLTQERRTEIQVEVAQSLAKDSASDQYRAKVREFLADRILSKFEEIRLEQLREKLGLSITEANQILAQEQQPIQAARAEYKEMLLRLIEEGYYPFDDATQHGLQQLSQELELTEQEVTTIAHPILEAAEADYQQRLGRAQAFVENLGNGVALEMVQIPGGSFLMGSPAGEESRSDDEGPQHPVTIQPFLIGKFAVTQAQWRSVAGLPKINRDLDPDPSHFKGANRPVEQVSWEEVVEFCERLSRKTGKQYRLPSEAEWEYACRAGTTTPFHFGETITTDLANYCGNYTYGSGAKGKYREQTVDVGSFPPNAFGLYDMHGNVAEWCLDPWHDSYQGSPVDGSAWIEGGDSFYRLLRGGNWNGSPIFCRSAFRARHAPGEGHYRRGFRVACSLSWTS